MKISQITACIIINTAATYSRKLVYKKHGRLEKVSNVAHREKGTGKQRELD